MRITKSMLEARLEQLNKLLNAPKTPYRRDKEGRLLANVGHNYLSKQLGGYCVHTMMNEGGGVTTPITHAHVPAKELFEKLTSYIDGFERAKRFYHIEK